jgi:hypothetical protein
MRCMARELEQAVDVVVRQLELCAVDTGHRRERIRLR